MTNNELFDEIKLISERLKEIFNPINESEIISQFYIGLLDDLVYRIFLIILLKKILKIVI